MSPAKKFNSISDAFNHFSEELINKAAATIPEESLKIFKKNLLARNGWTQRSYTNPATGDFDLERAPLNRENGKIGQGYSVVQAISIDTQLAHVTLGANIGFQLGNIDNIMKMSPRFLYYEYGTLSSQDSGLNKIKAYSIDSFSSWPNPYAPWSSVRVQNPNIDWAFKKIAGKGRFQTGLMIPARTAGRNSTPNAAIPAIRMYRGSAAVSYQEILKNKNRILKLITERIK